MIKFDNNLTVSNESEDYSSEDNNEEMEDNAYEEDGPGRPEMEMLRNTIAQSLMNEST
ncbi:hypothetical protein RchiOBHm_Chr2g0085491 [Rosa chinensis]|uniref:Uncharacterized protein n=1 Tax=Rosa chinensis TaxID=74649 RepID=A0A2P6RI46_ROSCH|nr:hypothetical protein RchiOBHm_Chr2g0085491 [Rosa chinensis]